jgi:Uma2 family endonuclease
MIAPKAGALMVQLSSVPPEVGKRIGLALADHARAHRVSKGRLELAAELTNVTWSEYKALLHALGDLHVRHYFVDGVLHIMSPLHQHEWIKGLIGRFIEALALDQDIDIKSIGSTTITSDHTERGFEPDEAYYFASEPKVRGKLEFEPDRDPPPDLVIEIDVTNKSQGKLSLFAAMKVPEVWIHDGKELHFLQRSRHGYKEVESSIAIPYLCPSDVTRFLDRQAEMSETKLVKQFVAWARRRRKAFEKEQQS